MKIKRNSFRDSMLGKVWVWAHVERAFSGDPEFISKMSRKSDPNFELDPEFLGKEEEDDNDR